MFSSLNLHVLYQYHFSPNILKTTENFSFQNNSIFHKEIIAWAQQKNTEV